MEALKTKKDFIEFFNKIPAKQWITDAWTDAKGRHCALGHLNERFSDNETLAELKETKKHFRGLYKTSIDVLMNVNDNCHEKYNSKKLKKKTSDIKGRVLAYLKKK